MMNGGLRMGRMSDGRALTRGHGAYARLQLQLAKDCEL